MNEDFRGVSPTSVRDTLDEGPGWRVQQNGAILLVKNKKWDLVSLGSDPIQIQANFRWHLRAPPFILIQLVQILKIGLKGGVHGLGN